MSYASFSSQDWEEVENCLARQAYPLGALILYEGQICRKLYFLETGFLRFSINRDGEEVTKFFTAAPYCFTSQRSFTDEIPSTDNIEVLEFAKAFGSKFREMLPEVLQNIKEMAES